MSRPNSGPDEPISSQGQARRNSQPESSSQPPAVPAFPREQSRSSINALLNNGPAPSRALVPTNNALVMDKDSATTLIQVIAKQTSGCSVEQLEQIHSAMMSEIWRTRGEWDRAKVIDDVARCFEEVYEDIQEMQKVAMWSMSSQDPQPPPRSLQMYER